MGGYYVKDPTLLKKEGHYVKEATALKEAKRTAK
jgi:hypothetical protein